MKFPGIIKVRVVAEWQPGQKSVAVGVCPKLHVRDTGIPSHTMVLRDKTFGR